MQSTMDNSTIASLKRDAERHKLMAEKIAKFLEELQSIENGNTLPENGNAMPAATQEPELIKTRPSMRPSPVTGSVADAHGRFSRMTQIEAVETILKERGKATVGSIFEELLSGGKPVLKPMYVSTLLSRNKNKFRTLGGGVWTLVQPEFLNHDSSTTQGSVPP
jgi:hypothetical protein